MRVFLGLVVLIVVAVAPAQSASAKGVLDRIVVTMPGGRTIEVEEGSALYEFNPWASRYLDGVVSDVPVLGVSIEVGFDLDTTGNGSERIYTFTYSRDAVGDGYIYLPGVGDADYQRNITTILASDGTWRNGAWHRASDAWVAFVASLTMIQPPSTGDAGLR